VSDLNLDETLMRRFLLGDVSEAERDRIEERFIVDHEAFEALYALEDELILEYLRQELPDEVEAQFRAAMLSTPAQRRRVDEMRPLLAAAEAVAKPWWHWPPQPFVLLAATAAAVLILTAGLMVRQRSSRVDDSRAAGTPQTAPAAPATIATFFLMPTVRAANEKPVNVWRIPRGTERVELQMIVPAEPGPGIRAELHRPDGTLVPIVGAPATRVTPQGLDVTWVIPASAVPPGQYDLALISETAGRAPENIANRSFTIEP
jgi:hypothetical protein